MKKHILGFIFGLCVAAGAVMALPMSASAADGGTCGENLTWTLDAGVLTISGTGDMTDYEKRAMVPWHSQCESIIEVVIGDEVTSISDHAFYYCINMTNATIGKKVADIGEDAFLYCDKLNNVIIPEGVKTISEGAFSACTSMTSIDIPDSVTYIGDYAFNCCYGVQTVSLGNGVKHIGEGAFASCVKLKYITIPESLEVLEVYAFLNCQSLTGLIIPANVKIIDMYEELFGDIVDEIYFGGTPEEWEDLSENVDKGVLSEMTIYYNTTEVPEEPKVEETPGPTDEPEETPEPQVNTITYADNTVTVEFEPSGRECVMLVAVYDEVGRLLSLSSADVTQTDSELTFISEVKSTNIIKALQWNGIQGMEPVSAVISTIVE